MFVIMSGYRQNSDYVTAFRIKLNRTAIYGCYIFVFIILLQMLLKCVFSVV